MEQYFSIFIVYLNPSKRDGNSLMIVHQILNKQPYAYESNPVRAIVAKLVSESVVQSPSARLSGGAGADRSQWCYWACVAPDGSPVSMSLMWKLSNVQMEE